MTKGYKLYMKRVGTLAYQLERHTKCTQSQAMKIAHKTVKAGNVQVVEYTPVTKAKKAKARKAKRAVEQTPWKKTHTIKGKGTPLKPGQRIFTDVARKIAGKHDTISCYYPKLY